NHRDHRGHRENQSLIKCAMLRLHLLSLAVGSVVSVVDPSTFVDNPLMPAALAAPRPPINARSVALGLAGVILICALTPYNDYALNNTFLIGNNFPLGVVMLLFGFAIAINGPISRFWPAQKFSAGEITVAFSMTLVSCALPSSGLMRYFPPSLVSPWHLGQTDREFIDLMETLHVP